MMRFMVSCFGVENKNVDETYFLDMHLVKKVSYRAGIFGDTRLSFGFLVVGYSNLNISSEFRFGLPVVFKRKCDLV